MGQPAGRRRAQLGAADCPASTTAQREDAVVQHAAAVARSVKPEMIRARDVEGIGRLLQTGVTPAGVRRVDVYELSDGQPVRVAAADASGRSTSETHAASDALAAGVAKGSASIAHQSLAERQRARAGGRARHRSGDQAAGGRRRRQRSADRQADHRIAAHHRGLRELQPAALPDAAAAGHVPLALPDDDADDSRQRHVDGPLPGQAHHAAGADARPGRARDWRGTSRSPHRAGDPRRVRLPDRGLQLDGGGAGHQPEHAGAEEPAARGPAPVYRDDPGAHRHGSRLDRRRRAASKPSTAPPAGCSRWIAP